MRMPAFPTRVLCFRYDNLHNGMKTCIWLREKRVVRRNGLVEIMREVDWAGDTGWHGNWSFEGAPEQPYHTLILSFNSRWPQWRKLHGSRLMRTSATQWEGRDYVGRKVIMHHCDTFVLQNGGHWLSERERMFVNILIPSAQDGNTSAAPQPAHDAPWYNPFMIEDDHNRVLAGEQQGAGLEDEYNVIRHLHDAPCYNPHCHLVPSPPRSPVPEEF